MKIFQSREAKQKAIEKKLKEDKMIKFLETAKPAPQPSPPEQGKEAIAIEALRKIKSPIAYLQNNLKEGEVLDGGNAMALANSANYLRSIAEEALYKIESWAEQADTPTPVDEKDTI